GFAKRTLVDQYRVQGRGGIGIKAANIPSARGSLVGALIVGNDDEVMCIRSSGSVTRSRVDEVEPKGRDTMGVKFVALDGDDAVVAVARNEPEPDEPESADPSAVVGDDGTSDAGDAVEAGQTDEGAGEGGEGA
ncbi:MAG: DNA gyrase C-terminal beta-propeller domain-containing protein, partial [Mycobacteriales bacterium]